MLLDIAHTKLGWPSRAVVLTPPGAGPAVYARLVQSKVGRALVGRGDVAGLEMGILAADPNAPATEPPLAVVCEFKGVASDATIEEAHRLAWNFCRAPLLVTLEPHLLRAWSSCEPPNLQVGKGLPRAHLISLPLGTVEDAADFSSEAARALSWVSLVSGNLFRQHAPRFVRQKCADRSLLENLRDVREELLAAGLTPDTTHDLLARLMFVQFLFDRKDEDGRAALTEHWLGQKHEDGELSDAHKNLESVLRNHGDTYRLFRLLNERFNGDLFPGKTTEDLKTREADWQREMSEVTPEHLATLADFVSGNSLGRGRHRSLWPLYSFDVIPLEFISSIYETFVQKDKGTHYTPAHLVDIVLDTCLPWDDDEWDVKVLDPSCGSGIFLVKAFQRLVYRWRRSRGFAERPGAEVLRKILCENLFGVDINRDAVRVACFSLYLAMCDEIEPRHVWERVKFPPLREKRLIQADFFDDSVEGIKTLPNHKSYDIVVGNAPWGTGTMSDKARTWVKKWQWGSSYKNIGPLFLAKALWLAKSGGRVAMLQPSGLLFNTIKTAVDFRRRLLEKYKVEQIINLSALRFGLFSSAVSPACVLCVLASPPDTDPIMYVSPKPSLSADDDFRIVFDAYDYHPVLPHEAIDDSTIWTTLMWGGRRDRALLRRLCIHPSIAKLEAEERVRTRTGIIRGSNPTKRQKTIVGRPILDQDDFPAENFPYLDPASLPTNENAMIHWKDSTDWSAFEPPQLVLKLAWRRATRRFQARIVKDGEDGVLCSTSYVSCHFSREAAAEMRSACVTYNSKLAAYFLLLTSSRFASFIQEVNADDLLRVPFPKNGAAIERMQTPPDADEIVRAAFGIKAADWALVEDAFAYTLSAFQAANQGRRRSKADESLQPIPTTVDRPMLELYGDTFARVIRAGFGADKRVRVTVYRTPEDMPSPVHLVAVHLGWPDGGGIHYHDVSSAELLTRLAELSHLLEQRSSDESTLYRRVARAYDVVRVAQRKVPTVYICKPNLPRYWTRSMAMRDADEVSADLVAFASARRPERGAISA